MDKEFVCFFIYFLQVSEGSNQVLQNLENLSSFINDDVYLQPVVPEDPLLTIISDFDDQDEDHPQSSRSSISSS